MVHASVSKNAICSGCLDSSLTRRGQVSNDIFWVSHLKMGMLATKKCLFRIWSIVSIVGHGACKR